MPDRVDIPRPAHSALANKQFLHVRFHPRVVGNGSQQPISPLIELPGDLWPSSQDLFTKTETNRQFFHLHPAQPTPQLSFWESKGYSHRRRRKSDTCGSSLYKCLDPLCDSRQGRLRRPEAPLASRQMASGSTHINWGFDPPYRCVSGG